MGAIGLFDKALWESDSDIGSSDVPCFSLSAAAREFKPAPTSMGFRVMMGSDLSSGPALSLGMAYSRVHSVAVLTAVASSFFHLLPMSTLNGSSGLGDPRRA